MSVTDPVSRFQAEPDESDWRMAEHWPDLAVAVTDQSIETVNLLMRGLDLLMQKGRLSPAEYKVLALPAERLKHCSISAQQIVRFQSGRVRQSHEKIDLAYLLECVLHERRTELALMGITVRRKFKPVDVLIDPTLGFGLTKAMLDWSTPFGNRIDLRLETAGEPARARLSMKTHTDQPRGPVGFLEDGIHWLLVKQIAATDGGIEVERHEHPDGVELTALFRRTLAVAQGLSEAQPASASDPDSVFKSISGAYVVVLSADSELRLDAVGALRKLGLVVDGVGDCQQAREAIHDRSVQLLVVDASGQDQAVWNALFNEMQRQHPHTPVVEIASVGSEGLALPAGVHSSRVVRESVGTGLGSAVMFALSRSR